VRSPERAAGPAPGPAPGPTVDPADRATDAFDHAAPVEGGRRILNVVVALLGLIAMVPVMLVIAIAVRLTSEGPVRFVQTRIGIDRRRRGSAPDTGTRRRDLGGVPFRMYKFRTMHVQSDDTQCWATAGDARITPVGRVLRQFRIDELPQLFNVLRGDMNVVGPRPEQPLIFERLRGRIARYARRQRVRPGITGWAQVNLAYDRHEEDARRKLTYDLEYIGRQSLTEDLRIIARTLPVMLGRRGAH
jgi:lipopolysaccharide/colanic/teichoic acid biosynthesis glycosyltransferase